MLSVGEPRQQELDVPECMRLLGTAGLGRLGFTQAALPIVAPVTYRLVGGSVRIPAIPGSREASAIRNAIVVLGVDSFDGGDVEGWAVTVVGPVRLVDGRVLLLEPALVTGWRRTAGRPC